MTAPIRQTPLAAGAKLRGVFLAQLVENVNFVIDKPVAELRQTAAQTITTGTYTALTFGAETFDDDPSGTGGHSTSVNTSRFTVVYAGVYVFAGGGGFAASSTGLRGLRWAVNGSAIDAAEIFMPPTASSTPIYTARPIQRSLGVGDYVELQAFHSHGSNLNTSASSTDQPSMSVAYRRIA